MQDKLKVIKSSAESTGNIESNRLIDNANDKLNMANKELENIKNKCQQINMNNGRQELNKIK